MTALKRFLLGLAIAGTFLAPLSASALGVSFGGRIVTVIPCISVLGPSLHVTIVPAGLFPTSYIWTPATLTFLAGPPRNPGQQVLGVADIPYTCAVGKIPFFGLRMQMIGTSALI